MNSQRIKGKIRSLIKENNINFNILLRQYMYERFIERLSVSKYKFNFILKGGYYLSLLFGLENRSTMDIDMALKSRKLSKENLIKIINEIIKIDICDGVIFTFDDISKIRTEDEYGGYRVTLTAKIDNVRETFNIDVATGDPITPKEINYKYNLLIENRYINILAYNLETVLAEKLETILTRGEKSSRMKDYYDIYIIMNLKSNDINVFNLKNAVKNTFNKRGFNNDISVLFNDIKGSKILEKKWNSYVKKKKIFNVSFNDTLISIEKLLLLLESISLQAV